MTHHSTFLGIRSICHLLWMCMHLRSVRRQFQSLSEWLELHVSCPQNLTSCENNRVCLGGQWRGSENWDGTFFKELHNLIKSITLYCSRLNRYCSVLHYHWIVIIKHWANVTDLIPLGHYKISWTALKASNTDLTLISLNHSIVSILTEQISLQA